MRLEAHYKNAALQHLGFIATEEFKPTKTLLEGMPALSIDITRQNNSEVNELIALLKKQSKPFIIQKCRDALPLIK